MDGLQFCVLYNSISVISGQLGVVTKGCVQQNPVYGGKDFRLQQELKFLHNNRSPVVDWLEGLGYGAESRRKALVRGWALPCDDWKTLCQPSSKWVPFSNQGRIRQRKERDGLRLSSPVPKIQQVSNPHSPPRLLGYGKPLHNQIMEQI